MFHSKFSLFHEMLNEKAEPTLIFPQESMDSWRYGGGRHMIAVPNTMDSCERYHGLLCVLGNSKSFPIGTIWDRFPSGDATETVT